MALFITGTDTDVGKTILSAWLCLHLGAEYWKPIQTGAGFGTDAETVAALSGAVIHPTCYGFVLPVSPHQAAQAVGQQIDLAQMPMPITQRPLIIEGAGGVLTPLNDRETMIDLIAQLKVPVIVAAHTRLGTINHTCLTLDALRHRHIPVLGVVMIGAPSPDTRDAITHYGQTHILAELPLFSPLTGDTLRAYPCPDLCRKPIQKYNQELPIHANTHTSPRPSSYLAPLHTRAAGAACNPDFASARDVAL